MNVDTMKELLQPSDKKQFSALDVVVSEYAKTLMNEGQTIGQAKKNLYTAINSADCLSKTDKDSRKATIRKAFGKLVEAEESQWDLTDMMQEALKAEG